MSGPHQDLDGGRSSLTITDPSWYPAPLSEIQRQLPGYNDKQLDILIQTTDLAAVVNRLARIERGRRTEKLPPIRGDLVTPGVTRSESNKRSEERVVAEWFDATPDAEQIVEVTGWKSLVNKARAHRRETTPAEEEPTPVDIGRKDWISDDGRMAVLAGDFREKLGKIEAGSVDLIFTDPPYPKDDLHLYGDLAEHAATLLGPRGILLTYTGNFFVPEILNLVTPHLNYGWQFCILMDQGSRSRIMGRHIMQAWKPCLAFTKGKWPSGEWVESDVVTSPGRTKDNYEWQQNIVPARWFIEKYAPPNGLVVDPFLGVGTFGVAAVELGRKFVGVELDRRRHQRAVKRISGSTSDQRSNS